MQDLLPTTNRIAVLAGQTPASAATCLAALICAIWLIRSWKPLKETTLMAPLVWAMIAWLVICFTELLVHSVPMSPETVDVARYIAALSTFCPAMALLGAKRPQDRGWQFIVLSLWVILAMPAVQPMLFARTSRFELHFAWSGFLIVLVAVSVVNYLPTRFSLPALMCGAAQVLLLQFQLPLFRSTESSDAIMLAMVLYAGALMWVSTRYVDDQESTDAGWNRVWIDFRDRFGTVWALRVMERFNQAASSDEPRLAWEGIKPIGESKNDEMPLSDSQIVTLRMLLRRFVNDAWIEERLP